MSLESPKLDDRSFEDLVNEARARISLYTPEWTDHNLSDPGITLLELFAWMTDIILYRLNRVPDKHFIKFMELIGMRLQESIPARTDVTFWLSAPQPGVFKILSGTEVATFRTETEPAIVFTTDGELEIKPPKVSFIMTAHEGTDSPPVFNTHDVNSVAVGYENFKMFMSSPPRTDDALYIGFEEDLSNHLIGLDIEVDTAEGAGIDPTKPPYVWEVQGRELEQNWIPVDVDIDTTKGFNVSGVVRLHIPAMRRSARNKQNAYWVRCRLDDSLSQGRYDVSPQVNRLALSSVGGTVSATNVSRVREEVLGRSDGSPGQRFYLEHVPVVARTVEEYLVIRYSDSKEERWQEVSDFSSSGPSDRHYTLDSNSGEIRLGPALQQPDRQIRRFGAIPEKGCQIVMRGYRYGGGQAGNVGANSLRILRTSIAFVERVSNRKPAIGGLDAEQLDHAKMRVPGHLRSLNRAVTASDFEYLAMQAAEEFIGRVFCLQPPQTARGENRILVVPRVPIGVQGFISPESLELKEDVRERIQSYLDERRLLSTRVEVTTPEYQWVETVVRFKVSQHHEPEKVRKAVEDRLLQFVNPLVGGVDSKGWEFGRDLLVSDIMAALSGVPGVNFIRSVKLYPVTYQNRQYKRGDETDQISLASYGVVVSYQHTIIPD